MGVSTAKSAFGLGIRDGLPFILVLVPFAFLFGVVATEAGLSVFEALSFSLLVTAGAAQFTAVQLMVEQAPTWIVLATALAVNLRMAMYSAALVPWLGEARPGTRAAIAALTVDQSYACSVLRYQENPDWPLSHRVAFFFGTVTPVVPLWWGMTLVGALTGQQVPDWLALDFAVPIAFLAIIAPMLRSPAHIAAAFASILFALLFAWMPAGTGLLVAAALAMIVGAQVEARGGGAA